jgi:hypothetical protein
VTTETPPELAPPAETATGTIRCPRCGAEVGRDQEWCLECGYAARTTLARTPRWKLPIAIAAAVVAIALAALAVAFVDLTDDAEPQPAATMAPPTTPAATTPAAPAVPTTPAETAPAAPTPETAPPERPTATGTGTGGEPAP